MAVILKVTIYNVQEVECLNLGTISMLYLFFHKYYKAKNHNFLFLFLLESQYICSEPIHHNISHITTYITSHTKVLIYFTYVLKNIFIRTKIKYRFPCIFSRTLNFSFQSFWLYRIQNIWKTRIIFTSSNTKFTFYRFWLSKIQNIWRRIIFRTVTKVSFQTILC